MHYIRLKGVNIPFSDRVSNLGLIINKDLNWMDQINRMRKRINHILRCLWTITKHCSVDFKRRLFFSFVLPHFIYCDTTLFGMFEYNFNKIQMTFNACVRYIFGLRKFDHISEYKNLVLGCSLRELYFFRVCSLIFKILKAGEPVYLFRKFSSLPSLRSNNLLIPRNVSDIFNRSFFVRGISMWNSLSMEIKSSHTPSAFKRNYFALMRCN